MVSDNVSDRGRAKDSAGEMKRYQVIVDDKEEGEEGDERGMGDARPGSS